MQANLYVIPGKFSEGTWQVYYEEENNGQALFPFLKLPEWDFSLDCKL